MYCLLIIIIIIYYLLLSRQAFRPRAWQIIPSTDYYRSSVPSVLYSEQYTCILFLGGGPGPTQTRHPGIGTNIASTWVDLEPTCPQHGPNMSQHGANLGPPWTQLEPTWSQLGSTWAQICSSKPTWANLEPTWGNLEAQKPLRETKKCKMQTDL